MIYNNHNPLQHYGTLGDILLIPIGYQGKSHDKSSRKTDTIGHFDTDIDIPHKPLRNIVNRNRESRSDLRRPAHMLYKLLQKYGSFSDSDFGTVYNQWFGHW